MTQASLVRLDTADRAPIYVQIQRAIRAAVATGRLGKGAQLPTVRQLAVELRVNANTVAKVYSDLEREGLVETRRGVGTFVRDHDPSQLRHRPNRQALRDFTGRVLEDAAARGFSREEFVAELQLQLSRELNEAERGLSGPTRGANLAGPPARQPRWGGNAQGIRQPNKEESDE